MTRRPFAAKNGQGQNEGRSPPEDAAQRELLPDAHKAERRHWQVLLSARQILAGLPSCRQGEALLVHRH